MHLLPCHSLAVQFTDQFYDRVNAGAPLPRFYSPVRFWLLCVLVVSGCVGSLCWGQAAGRGVACMLDRMETSTCAEILAP